MNAREGEREQAMLGVDYRLSLKSFKATVWRAKMPVLLARIPHLPRLLERSVDGERDR